MTELSALVSPIVKIAASGAAQTLSAVAPLGGVAPVYDITLTAACTFTLSAAAGAGAMQKLTAVLRQDGTAGRVPTLPLMTWPNGTPPTLNLRAGYYDVIEFTTFDGGVTWLGSVIALAAQIPTVPGAPVILVAPGTRFNDITILDGPTGGAPIKARRLYRAITSGGTQTAIGPVTLVSGVYRDTGLTNGTAYFYKGTDANDVGEGPQSAEVSATPYGYVNVPANDTATVAQAQANTASKTTTAFADVRLQVNLAAFPGSGSFFLAQSATGVNPAGGYGFYINANGTMDVLFLKSGTSASSFPAASTGLPASVLGQPVWLRTVINKTSAAVTVGGVTYAANTVYYYYSLDGANPTNWTALGTAVSAAGDTIDTSVQGYFAIMANGYTPGARVLRAMVTDGNGAVLFNPDFTTLAAGTTSFQDTAATPNTFTITAPAAVA
jgi:hypothetical protein